MRLLLVDATNAIMRRAMVARELLPDEVAKDVLPRILRAAKDLSCTHVIAAFDDPDTNWRYDLYPEYKGGGAPDENTKTLMRAAWRVFTQAGIYCDFVKNFEADDLIATRVHRTHGRLEVFTLSSDNDLLQLLQYGHCAVVQYAPKGAAHWLEVRVTPDVEEKFGIVPEQYADFQAIVGGKNKVPGLPNIGPKKAAKLLQEHKDIDGIFDAGALPQDFYKWAVTARWLHRLRTDAPVQDVAPPQCLVPTEF